MTAPTGQQAALFDAPTMDGQAPLFGNTYEWATDPAGPELLPAERDDRCIECGSSNLAGTTCLHCGAEL